MRRIALAAALLAVAFTASASAAHAGPPPGREKPELTPVLQQVTSTPRWYRGDDGRVHLAYEVQLTNTLAIPIDIRSVRVLDGERRPVATFSGEQLEAAMSLIGTPESPTTTLPPSSVGITWIDLDFADASEIPKRIEHRLTVDIGPGHPELGRMLTSTGAPARVARRAPLVLSPPLRGGRWVGVVGPHRRAIYPVNGHVRLGQRFAVDFSARLDGRGRTHAGDPDRNASYFNYGQPVLAVNDGVVVAAVDRLPNQIPNHKVAVPVAEADGNHVILRLEDGSFAAYGHLAPGSVRVRPGQRVRGGQVLGKLGNSGNSGGPHLHFQVMDRPSFVDAEGLPFVLDRFRFEGRVPSLEAFIEADADPAAPPVPYRPARDTDRRKQGFTSLEVVSFATTKAPSRSSSAPAAASRSFSRLVRIPGGRKLYLTCRGSGGPTAVLISGFRGAYDDWTHVVPRAGAAPRPSRRAVLPRVGRFTRVCGYDRPGTVNFGGEMSPSTPVRQPTSSADDVGDLHALLKAARVPGPYILVAHSWGGMSAYLYASRHPEEVAGLVLLDAGSVFLKSALKPDQWRRFASGGRTLGKPRTLEAVEYERSVAEILREKPPPAVPAVVLTSDHPFDFGAGPETWRAWRTAQRRLAAALGAKHIAETSSGHYIAGERPGLVVGQIQCVVRAFRTGSCDAGHR